MHINFNGIHFTVTTIANNKLKDIIAVIFGDHIFSNWIRFFSFFQFCDFSLNRF